jgi:hypothetical protein
MGVIYKAEDTRPRPTVALKLLPGEAAKDHQVQEPVVQTRAFQRVCGFCGVFPLAFGGTGKMPESQTATLRYEFSALYFS